MDASTLLATVTTVKTAYDFLISIIKTGNDMEIAEAKQKMMSQLFEVQAAALQVQNEILLAQQKNASLSRTCEELNSKIIKLEKQLAERGEYELIEYTQGVFVYKNKPLANTNTPVHYLCQPCYDNKLNKSVLQLSPNHRMFICPECGHKYTIKSGDDSDIRFTSVRSSRYSGSY